MSYTLDNLLNKYKSEDRSKSPTLNSIYICKETAKNFKDLMLKMKAVASSIGRNV